METIKVKLQELIDLRKKKGYTQIQLAELLGITRQYLGDIENGKYIPSWEVMFLIADTLGISTTKIVKIFKNKK